MQKSHRIRTTVGTDKNIRVNINQDFDFLEILSLKLKQEDVYARFCADYGVVAGRVITNGGYGVPNVNVSIFVPLSNMDQDDEVISTLYPYKKPTDKNEDGYRYNLLPYVQEYGGHTPTGTFPDRTDILERKEVLEVYEKYYRYTVKTNDSGDFMIVGVPLGMQIITMDLDLSNIGCFSLRPSDLIRMGIGTAEQFNGPLFKSSTDLSSLPQLLFGTKDIEVTSFWGEKDLCNVGITRTDFDLRDYGIEIKPQSVFMGSLFSTSDEDFLKTNCKPKKTTGKLCDLVTGPGEVLAIRQTIDFDSNGQPVLEQFSLPEGGKIVDDEGTWLVDLPMNMDYVVTNEFGDQVISNDPKVGIPTTGKYRFRIKYQNEGGIDNDILRADYLVPNIREYGWLPTNNNDGPYKFSAAQRLQQKKSYAFSLDWNDYADPISAINCEDTFYKFNHNKVYTIANFLDRWKWGANRDKHLGIKEINDRSCTSKINRFPTNDAIKNFDFLVFLFNIIIALLTPTIFALIIILHVLALLYPIFRIIINMFIWLINLFYDFLCALSKIEIFNWYPFDRWSSYCSKPNIEPLSKENPFKKIPLPMISYPDCEACPCEDAGLEEQSSPTQTSLNSTIQNSNVSFLADVNYTGSYGFKFSSDDNIKQSFNQLFAGFYEKTPQCLSQLYRLPVAKVPTNKYYLGFDVTLAQSMNLLNVKFSYFANSALGPYPKLGGSIITYKTTNQNPTTNAVEPSDDIYDQPLIILCDAGTLNQITPGLLLSFYNPTNIPDPNMTGLTIANQFNTNAITGSTPFNTTALVSRPITFIKPDGTVVNTAIKCKITDSEKPYSHTAGVEYFQLITGGTVASFRSLVTTSTGPLYNYIFNKKQSIAYPSSSPILIGQNSLTNYNSNETLEILILTRGVDPYTQKQKIKYDLSSLFGHAVNSANVTVEGEYYLNIPIQPNTGLLLSNSTWRNDEYSPESHNITNNTNISLYHEPFGFNVDTTLFSAFTSNNPHYYNSTDKSQSTFTSYPLPSSCEAKKLGDYTVNGQGYESSPATASSYKNTMLFEYALPVETLIYSQNFSAISPPGWYTFGGGWDLNNFFYSCTSTFSMGIEVQSPGTNNDWAYTSGINMVAGKSYKMRFKQKTHIFGPYVHKLRITVANAVTYSPSTVAQILDLPNLTNATCIDRVTNDFNCTTSGTYYFGFQCYSNPNTDWLTIDNVEIYEFVPSYITQGRIEGGSFMASGIQTPGFYTNGKELTATSTVENQARLYSPAYHMAAPNDITMTNNNRMVFRSDRLPTSDKPQMKGNSSLSLHLNDNFAYYVINEDGTAISFTMTTTAADSSNDSADAGEDGNNFTTKVIESFDCQGMTALGCYEGVGTAFQKIEDCSKEKSNNNLGNPDNKRVNGGCYYLVQSPLLVSIPKDIRYFAEWKSRFRMMFAACRGVFAEMFQNNWVNGTLYMFSFKKRTRYSAIGQPKSYKFCGAIINNPRKGLGPIIYTEGTTNSFFYRSTPYDGTNFLGQMPERQLGGWSIPEIYSTNRRNLYFPTTIMDLGSRDQFTKEVCFNPQLESVYVDTLLSTSNQDTSDILQLGIISRLINSNFWGQIAGLGDGSVNRMFSREDNRLDGDIVQLYSINSEYGVAAFSEDEYVGSGDIYVNAETNGNSVVGIFFSSDTKNRKVLSPGITVLGPGLSNYFGYPDTQEVPMYKWRSSVTTTIFGDQDNDWYTDYEVTNSSMYSTKYQGMDFTQTDYFHVNNGNNLGYIYNYAADGVTPNASWPSGNNQKFVVGAPNHFYFGLNKGKSAINRYITKYILNRNE